jgi:hypothetical protein
MSEEEVKVSNTSQGRASITVSLTTSSQLGGHNARLKMVNQDTTPRLPVFHETSKDDAQQHWFTCEAIWSVKWITNEASKIT